MYFLLLTPCNALKKLWATLSRSHDSNGEILLDAGFDFDGDDDVGHELNFVRLNRLLIS